MMQAVDALREHEGWLIDYEDPIYSSFDTTDATDHAWRVEHPDGKGAQRIAGTIFRSEFPDPATLAGAVEEKRIATIVGKIVADYNDSSNPGRFELRIDGERRISVVGISARDSMGRQEIQRPLLDLPVVYTKGRHTAQDLLEELCKQLTNKSGSAVTIGTTAASVLLQTSLDLADDQPMVARRLLNQISSAARYSLVWDLAWDPNESMYVLNFTPVVRSWTGADGNLRKSLVKAD